MSKVCKCFPNTLYLEVQSFKKFQKMEYDYIIYYTLNITTYAICSRHWMCAMCMYADIQNVKDNTCNCMNMHEGVTLSLHVTA